LQEAFLVQMNDFDRLLDSKLRQMLDPVVATRPPTRRDPSKRVRKPILAVEVPRPAFGGVMAEMIPVVVVEPIAVAIPAVL
jgi:hypothetical protein